MIIRTAICLSLATILTACSGIPYRIDVDQGNIIDQQSLSRLRVGMNKKQVQQTLGSTLLQDLFHKNRWDYIHRYKAGKTQDIQESKVTLYFTNNLLSQIEKSGYKTIEAVPLPYSVKPQ